jgi:hypothetical protein
MNNNIERNRSRQQLNINKIIQFLKTKSRTYYGVLNKLLYLDNANLPIFISQSEVASKVGVHRITAHYVLHELKEAGFLTITNRGYKKTCIYEINPLFRGMTVRRSLKHILPALLWIPLTTYICHANENNNQQVSKENYATLLKRDYFSLFNCSSVVVRYNNLSTLDYRDSHKKEISLKQKIPIEKVGIMIPEILLNPTIIGLRDDLKLTPAGECKLTAYPQSALQEAHRIFLSDTTTSKKNPFGLFMLILEAHCSKNHITLRWPKAYELMERFGITKNAACSLEQSDYKNNKSQQGEYKDSSSANGPSSGQRIIEKVKPPIYYYTDWKKNHLNGTRCNKCANGACLMGNMFRWVKDTTPELREQAVIDFPFLREFIPSAFSPKPPPAPSAAETNNIRFKERSLYLLEENNFWKRILKEAEDQGPLGISMLNIAKTCIRNNLEELAELSSRIGSNQNKEPSN